MTEQELVVDLEIFAAIERRRRELEAELDRGVTLNEALRELLELEDRERSENGQQADGE